MVNFELDLYTSGRASGYPSTSRDGIKDLPVFDTFLDRDRMLFEFTQMSRVGQVENKGLPGWQTG